MKKLQVLLALWVLFSIHPNTSAQNVAINNTGSAGDGSAMLDVESSTKGVLVPRMTAAQRIAIGSPAEGLLVYQNDGDAGFYFYNGSAWELILGRGKGWSIGGNAGTDVANNYVGTSDAEDLAIGTNGVQRLRIVEGGAGTVVNGNLPLPGTVLSSFAITTDDAIGALSDNGLAVYGISVGAGDGVWGLADGSGDGVYGYAGDGIGVFGESDNGDAASLGIHTSNGTGVWGEAAAGGNGVYGFSPGAGEGVWGANNGSGLGVYGLNTSSGTAINALNNSTGRAFQAVKSNTTNTELAVGVFHDGLGRAGNFQNNNTGNYVTQTLFAALNSTSTATNASAVWGQSQSVRGGVFISSRTVNASAGAVGLYDGGGNIDAAGVIGIATANAGWGYGVRGQGNWFGVYATGDLGATGGKFFEIDHPLDPENKVLRHANIEANEILNHYRGNVQLDANGEGTVQLPDYFEEININFSYTLTAVGAPAPNLHISEEVSANQFKISGGQPGQKVSWVVQAERNDAYIKTYPEKRVLELEKKDYQKGKYLDPKAWGQPEERGVFYGDQQTTNLPLAEPSGAHKEDVQRIERPVKAKDKLRNAPRIDPIATQNTSEK